MSHNAPIPAAVQAAVATRTSSQTRKSWLSRALNGLTGHRDPGLPAQPVVDEGVVVDGIVRDAVAAAGATDPNTVPGPLPTDQITMLVAGLTAILGTMALTALAEARAGLADVTTTARGLYRSMPPGMKAALWVCLITLETVAVQKVLAEVLGLNQDLPRWVAAGLLAGVTAIAGTALASSWHSCLPADSDEPDGMIGRDLLRTAGWMATLAVALFAVGLVWVRVTSADVQSAGLLDEVPDMTWPHAVFIGGIVLLSFAVSFATKVTEMALESRTALRLTGKVQRTRSHALELVEATVTVLSSYVVLEARARDLAAASAGLWHDAFLGALPPDTRDRWVAQLADQPPAKPHAIPEPEWVTTLQDEIKQLRGRARTMALPAQDSMHDHLVAPAKVDVRDQLRTTSP